MYASVVYGEGLPLQALVYDAGSYADNHNALTINVYDCTLSGGVGASTGLAPTVTTGGLSGTINQATVYGLGTALGQAELSAWQNGDRNYVIQNLNAARQAAAALRLPTDGLDAVLGQLQRGATPATIYAQLASVRQGIEQISNKTCNCGVAANPLYTLSVGLQLGFAEIVAWQNGDRNYLAQQLNYARQNAAASGLSVQRLEYALSLLKAGPGVQPASGIWWNPAESGRGFVLDALGDTVTFGYYGYEESGVPVWYTGALTWNTLSSAFEGSMLRYSGGQSLSGGYVAPAGATVAGQVALSVNSSISAIPVRSRAAVQRSTILL